MAGVEQLMVTVPASMAASIREAVSGGLYTSLSEVVREALQDWELKSELRRAKLEALRKDLDEGFQDAAAGRLVAPDLEDILARGRALLASRAPSA